MAIGLAVGVSLLQSRAEGFVADFSSTPPNITVFGTAQIAPVGVGGSGGMQLTTNAQSQEGSFIINEIDPGSVVVGFKAQFRMLIGGGSTPPADGLSFNFANDLPNGVFGEEGAGTGITVSFDTYDNGDGEAPAADLKVGGVTINSVLGILSLFRTGSFVDVTATLDSNGAFTLIVAGQTVFDHIVTQYVPTGGRFGFGARTGFYQDNQIVDDVSIQTVVRPLITCPANIDPANAVPCQETTTNFTGVATASSSCSGAISVTYADTIDSGHNTISRTWTATDSCGASSQCTQTISFLPFGNQGASIDAQSILGQIVKVLSVQPPFAVTEWILTTQDGSVSSNFRADSLPLGTFAVPGSHDSIIIDFSIFHNGDFLGQGVNLEANGNTPCGPFDVFNFTAVGGVAEVTLTSSAPSAGRKIDGTSPGDEVTDSSCGKLWDNGQYLKFKAPVNGLANIHADQVPVDALMVAFTHLQPITPIACAKRSNDGSMDLNFSVAQDTYYFLGVNASANLDVVISVNSLSINCPSVQNPVACDQTGTNVTGVPIVSSSCPGPISITYADTIDTERNTILRTWTATDNCGRSGTCTQEIQFNTVSATIKTNAVVGSIVQKLFVEPSLPVTSWKIGDVTVTVPNFPAGVSPESPSSIIVDFSVFNDGKYTNTSSLSLSAVLDSLCATQAFNQTSVGEVPLLGLNSDTPSLGYLFSGKGRDHLPVTPSECGELWDESQYLKFKAFVTGIAHIHVDQAPDDALMVAFTNLQPVNPVKCTKPSNDGSMDMSFAVTQNTIYFLGVNASQTFDVDVSVGSLLDLSWSRPADITYGTPLGSLQLSAVANVNGTSVPGSFQYSPGLSTVLAAGPDQTLSVTFTPQDTTTYRVSTASVKINVNPARVEARITALDKAYDGNTAATLDPGSAQLLGLIPADVDKVRLDLSAATAAFLDQNVGTGKTVQVFGLNLTGVSALNYVLTVLPAKASIMNKLISVTGLMAADRPYDGNAAATLDAGSATLVGVVGQEDVKLNTAGATATFSDRSVGLRKVVLISGLTLTGANADNYTLGNAPLAITANITGRPLTVTVAGVNKIYDGSTSATVTLTDNRVSGDALDETYTTASFSDKNAGTAKTVNVSGIALSGADAGNYSLNNTTATVSASITPSPLTVTATPNTKTYDGSVTAQALPAITHGTLQASDTANFVETYDTAAAGNGKTLTPSGKVNDGNNGNNYSYTFEPANTGIINPPNVLSSSGFVGQTFTVSINSTLGVTYYLRFASTIDEVTWRQVDSQPGTGSTIILQDKAATDPVRFYQIISQ